MNGDSLSCTIEVVIEINLFSLDHSFFTYRIRLDSMNSGYSKHWKINQSPVLVNFSSMNGRSLQKNSKIIFAS